MDFGLTTTRVGEARPHQPLIRVAQETIVPADSSKPDRPKFNRICAPNQGQRIITNARIPARDARRLEEQGVTLTVV